MPAAPQHGPRPLPLFLNILWKETEGDPDLRLRALQGLRRYQEAERPPPPALPPETARAGQARLLHYGTGRNSGKQRKPVLFVPSLVNPPTVLDISESQSLLRRMAAAGHACWLVDWGMPAAEDRDLSLAGHVAERLVPLIRSLPAPPVIVGYCLGGTMALGAAALTGAAALVSIAAPWDFDRMEPEPRNDIGQLWSGSRSLCDRLGYVPMEVLQNGFWNLDPARTIRKYAAFAEMPPGSDEARAFLALEDWANGGPPLTFGTGRELFEDLYGANVTGKGAWRIGGQRVDPASLDMPTLSICSTTDRIVPEAIAPILRERWTLALGHVGMIVGSSAREKLWDPLSAWLTSHGA
jgi:polyhydroxyalkanoate synthase